MTQDSNVESTYTMAERSFLSRTETMRLKRELHKKKEHTLVMRIAAGLAASVVLLAGVSIFATHKNVTIQHGDEKTVLSTWHSEPEAILQQAGVSLSEHDRIGKDASRVSDGDTVVVEQAKLVAIEKNGKSEQIWTFADSANELIAAEKGITAVAVPGLGKDSIPAVSSEQSVTVVADGQTKPVVVPEGKTIREAIADAGIGVGPLDRVTMQSEAVGARGTAQAADAVTVHVSRVERSVNQEKITVDAPVEKQETDSLYKGQEKVIEEGSDGVTIKRTFVEKVDGKVVSSMELEDKVIAEPVTRVVQVGTKETSFVGEGVWGALARCESGGNPSIVSSNGLYHGLYQFSVPTWHSVGGTGLPSQASPEEQTERAKILQARSGWGQWPACSRQIGVR